MVKNVNVAALAAAGPPPRRAPLPSGAWVASHKRCEHCLEHAYSSPGFENLIQCECGFFRYSEMRTPPPEALAPIERSATEAAYRQFMERITRR